MIEIGFTGTRQGMTIPQHTSVVQIMLNQYKRKHHYGEDYTWHHGICVGSDEQLHNLALIFGFYIHGHPPKNDSLEADCTGFTDVSLPEAYLIRNHAIVDSCYLLVATPKEQKEIQRSGTWATIRYARTQSKNVIVINPLGECTA